MNSESKDNFDELEMVLRQASEILRVCPELKDRLMQSALPLPQTIKNQERPDSDTEQDNRLKRAAGLSDSPGLPRAGC
jgi:hypothetical protein